AIPLTGITSGPSVTNVGTVIVHRIARSSEATVSATAMAVPDKAKREFEKGKQAESKGRWAAAKEKFENALQRYPKFALAWLELGRIDQAEKSLMRGMRLDREHRVPQMEYLLGLVFARKQDYPSAVTHVSEYLRLSPNAPDSAVARQQLDEFQKLAESAAGQASR